MFKKVLTILISSFFIGNVVAWFSGAAPIEFGKIAYSEGEMEQVEFLQQEIGENSTDPDLMLELGQLFSHHNELEKAAHLLEAAYQQRPEDMLIRAAYYSNEGKRAGAMFDPAMGLYKLYRLRHAMDEVDQAGLSADSDFNVRLIRLITFSYVGEVSGHFERVFEDEAWFKNLMDSDPDLLPAAMQQVVYLSLANAYWVKAGEGTEDLAVAMDYYQKAIAMAPCPATMQTSCEQLGQMAVALGKS
ncbi:tetratricopeptide repeat protein [Microbulbifer sp. EKSA005]|uniref:tetratricopeptide repeat protein n=1 Tax=Microbulbifer sp. EKSA005 TaxID=3243364 RepID=UPI0040423591